VEERLPEFHRFVDRLPRCVPRFGLRFKEWEAAGELARAMARPARPADGETIRLDVAEVLLRSGDERQR
jgi:hypothetical protein